MKKKIKSHGKIRIFIVGISLIFRRGLRSLLANQRDFRVVGEAADYATAEKLIRKHNPDVLLLDFDMPRESALAALRRFAGSGLPTRIIVLTSQVDQPCILEALRLGALGIVEKNGALNLKIKAIRAVSRNECWANNAIISDALAYLRKIEGTHMPVERNSFGLTVREREILPAIIAGRANKEIAREFNISEETVKHHLTHIYDKLGVSNRLELAFYAVNNSLIVSGPAV
jgi:two-component system nitrate/nitrite response regulator NarL